MEQTQQDVQKIASETKQKVENASQQVIQDVKNIPPAVWGVAIGISLLLSIILHVITKQKEDKIFTAGVAVFGLLTGVLAVFLRDIPQDKQFVNMLVILSVFRVFFDISAISALVLSICPAIVNVVAGELKARGIIPQ